MINALPLFVVTIPAIYLAIIDIRDMRIPNNVLFPAFLATSLAIIIAGVSERRFEHSLISIAGGALATLIFFLIHLLRPQGLGMGDVKFAGLIGMAMSWVSFPQGLLGLAYGFIASAIFSIALIIFRTHKSDLLIPFGPFMVFGLLIIEFRALM